ncbi:hypothetical protein Ancab_030439 [Ancistrocladus abbreviatus]
MEEWVKLNTNGSVHNGSNANAGGILPNHLGSWNFGAFMRGLALAWCLMSCCGTPLSFDAFVPYSLFPPLHRSLYLILQSTGFPLSSCQDWPLRSGGCLPLAARYPIGGCLVFRINSGFEKKTQGKRGDGGREQGRNKLEVEQEREFALMG